MIALVVVIVEVVVVVVDLKRSLCFENLANSGCQLTHKNTVHHALLLVFYSRFIVISLGCVRQLNENKEE